MSNLPPHVREAAERIAAAEGIEVLDARLTGGGRARVLDVVVDHDEPIPAEVIARVTKQLSSALDELDPIRDAYTLQVGTPGLDRPLRTARDFRRQLGHEVRVTLPAAEPREVQGLVRAVDPDTLTLDAGGEQVRLPLAEIDQGRVVLPW